MEMKSYPVYKFSELTPAAKEKALTELRDCNVDYNGWADCVLDDWKEKLEKFGYTSPEIAYSGFCSQGDGASFTAAVDLPAWIKATKNTKRFAAILKWLKSPDEWHTANIIRIDRHYSHYNTVRAELEYDDTAPADMSELEAAITSHVRDLSRQLYRDLEKEYEYLTSDEAIKETIESNSWTFNARGHLDKL